MRIENSLEQNLGKNLIKLEKHLHKDFKCTGCNSCAEICTKGCIEMMPDEEGFLHPFVHADKCTLCGRCMKNCPQLNRIERHRMSECFACQHWDRNILIQSTSGGVFYELAREVIACGGVVAGAANIDNSTVRHITVETEEDIKKLQGSKYVQSDVSGIYRKIRNHLETGRTVLFSGTPCQVAGLKRFLNKEYETLFVVGLICHGVPSPRLFKEYICWLEDKHKCKIEKYNFRDKSKYGWGLSYSYTYSGKKKCGLGKGDPYFRAFLAGETYRKCCYECCYASMERVEDITLGDFWGIEKIMPEFPREKGVSLVLVNEHGMELFSRIASRLECRKADAKLAAEYQNNLKAPTERPPVRSRRYLSFFEQKENDFSEIKEMRSYREYFYVFLDKLPAELLLRMKGIKNKIWNR